LLTRAHFYAFHSDSAFVLLIPIYCNTFVIVQDETLSLRLSKSERRALRDRARREGVSQATLVRRALRAYGVTPEAEPRKSGYDVIKNLIGTHHGGPTDLSTNPEHLDDYGQ
jgi:hypothetical protein